MDSRAGAHNHVSSLERRSVAHLPSRAEWRPPSQAFAARATINTCLNHSRVHLSLGIPYIEQRISFRNPIGTFFCFRFSRKSCPSSRLSFIHIRFLRDTRFAAHPHSTLNLPPVKLDCSIEVARRFRARRETSEPRSLFLPSWPARSVDLEPHPHCDGSCWAASTNRLNPAL